MDWALADKVLKKTLVDLQKRSRNTMRGSSVPTLCASNRDDLGRSTYCMSPLPAQHRHRNATIRDACTRAVTHLFKNCMSRIMNTNEAMMFHWNTPGLDLTLNHLRCADHFVEFQQILNCW